jgi:hypothetical protein
MSATATGAALALLAALALNGAFLLQHAGARDLAAVDPRRPLTTLAMLLRAPVWTLGAALGVAGWALHVGAMREAPLSLVQAFVAGGLALAVPMAAIGLRRRLRGGELRALALMVLALLGLSWGLRADGTRSAFAPPALGLSMGVLAVAAAALAAGVSGGRRAAALGLAGGLLYGAADLALKAVTGLGGAEAVVTSPWLWAALAATAGAFFCFQRGLQADAPLVVIALMTAATNVGSIVGALVVFGDPLGRTPALAALHGAALALIVVAAFRLAPAQARLAATQRSSRPRPRTHAAAAAPAPSRRSPASAQPASSAPRPNASTGPTAPVALGRLPPAARSAAQAMNDAVKS